MWTQTGPEYIERETCFLKWAAAEDKKAEKQTFHWNRGEHTCSFGQTGIFFLYYCTQVLSVGRQRGVGGLGVGVNRIQLDVATAAIWERFQQTLGRDVSHARFTASDEHLLGIT